MISIIATISIMSISIVAGLALFSFIKPVTKSRFEEITKITGESVEESEKEEQPE